MKIFFKILLLLACSGLFPGKSIAQGTNPGSARWKELVTLLNQEIGTIVKVRNMGPDLKYRLLELYTQKAKLIKEYENQEFLKSPIKLRRARKKSYFFKKSRSQYQETMKLGENIIKTHPSYYRIGDIYYTLALNSRDFGDGRYLEPYMLKALSFSPKRSKIVHNIHTSLAEHYYNEKQYQKAISHYQQVLKNKNDQWYPKHLYNLSWCFLKTRRLNEAVKFNKASYFASKKKKYVDISDQALESIGIFHIIAGKVQEGVNFYKKNVANPIRFLIRMAEKASDDLGFKLSQYILVQASAIAQKKGLQNEELDVILTKMELYRKYKQYGLHYKSSLQFYRISRKRKIDKSYTDQAIDKISSLAGFLQLRLAKDMKKGGRNYNPKELKLVQSYFLILGKLDPANSDKYRYFQAETYYSVSEYEKALKSYTVALSRTKKLPGDRKPLQNKILNSMLSTLGIANLQQATTDKYTIYAYTNYLIIYPVSDKSQDIYQKLFNLYFARKRYEKSVGVLESYRKNYGKDIKVQREMLTRVVDRHIEDKNIDQIVYWINRLETGYLAFDESYIKKAQTVLGYILFEKYQIEEKRDKRAAIAGYQGLFKEEKYPRNIRARTAYKTSLLFLELSETENSFEWMLKALALFNVNELKEINKPLFTMTEQYYLSQDFKNSATLSATMLNRFCQHKIAYKNNYYENGIQFFLINEDERSALQVFNLGLKCNIPGRVIDASAKRMMVHFAENRQIRNMVGFYRRNPNLNSIKGPFILAMLSEYWDHKFDDDSKMFKQIIREMVRFGRSNQSRVPASVLEDVDLTLNFAKFEQKSQRFYNETFLDPTRDFDENTYNQKLEKFVVTLKNLREEADVYIQKGTVEVVLGSYRLLSDSYAHLAKMISEVNPSKKPKQFQKDFKEQMGILQKNLVSEADNFNQLGLQIIAKNEVLTPYNRFFYQGSQVSSTARMEYPAAFLLNTIDSLGELP